MSWFHDIWEDNEEFFALAALNAATPDSQLDKLQAELVELKVDHSVEEAADIAVCLLGFLIKSGITEEQFLLALHDKTQKNLKRKWALQPDGTYQHVCQHEDWVFTTTLGDSSNFYYCTKCGHEWVESK